MLGMAWGIATVVLLLAYGSGFERGLWVAFRSWGTNLVFIFPGRTSLQAGGTKAGSRFASPSTISITCRPKFLCSSASRPKRSSRAPSPLDRAAGVTASAEFILTTSTCAHGHRRRHSSPTPMKARAAASPFSAPTLRRKLVLRPERAGRKGPGRRNLLRVIGVLKHVIQNGDDNMNSLVYVSLQRHERP
jgi:hypothetical protein